MRSLFTTLAIMSLGSQLMNAQTNFDPVVYKQFLEGNKSLTASQLLNNYPPRTTYYASRTNPANLKDVPWFDSIDMIYDLTATEQELLDDNFFMVSERLRKQTWGDAMIGIYSNDLPLFLSTDFVLYTLHDSYDNILQTLEWQFLEPNLAALLEAMYN